MGISEMFFPGNKEQATSERPAINYLDWKEVILVAYCFNLKNFIKQGKHNVMEGVSVCADLGSQ